MTFAFPDLRARMAPLSRLTLRTRQTRVIVGVGLLALAATGGSVALRWMPDASVSGVATASRAPHWNADQTPNPEIWLSALATVEPTSFADPDYAHEPVLPLAAHVLPPLPERTMNAPRAAVSDDTVVAAQPIAPAPQAEVETTAQAEPAIEPTTEALALAELRAPRRSLLPMARPPRAPAPTVETPELAVASAETPATVEPASLFAVATSRLPQRRPETVARLASLNLDTPTPAVLAAPRAEIRSEPLSVPPLSSAIARADRCESALTRSIPRRSGRSGDGSGVISQLTSVSGSARDNAIVSEVLAGNIPDFLRDLVPVTFTGTGPGGQETRVTICVMPDYLAVGSDRDFVRVPLGLPAATRIAERFDMVLPTTRMVDAIYAQASVRLSPSPMDPTSQMASTNYFLRHNSTVEEQRAATGGRLGQLVSGHKKDLVLTNRLDRNPGRVAIYGWHRRSGSPIQPLSTVHGAQYADYSHGIRLISRRAYVNGRAVDLRDLLADSRLAGLVSAEGTISNRQLLAALN